MCDALSIQVSLEVLELLCGCVDESQASQQDCDHTSISDDPRESLLSQVLPHSNFQSYTGGDTYDSQSRPSLFRLLFLYEHEHVFADGSRIVHAHGKLAAAGGRHRHSLETVMSEGDGMAHTHVTDDGTVFSHEHQALDAEAAGGLLHEHQHVTQAWSGETHQHQVEDGTIIFHTHEQPAHSLGATPHRHEIVHTTPNLECSHSTHEPPGCDSTRRLVMPRTATLPFSPATSPCTATAPSLREPCDIMRVHPQTTAHVHTHTHVLDDGTKIVHSHALSGCFRANVGNVGHVGNVDTPEHTHQVGPAPDRKATNFDGLIRRAGVVRV